VRVVIAEDSVLLREGLTRLLGEAGHEVVAAAGEAEEFLREVGEHQPDVVVVDVRMPPTFTDEGLRAALVVRSTWPSSSARWTVSRRRAARWTPRSSRNCSPAAVIRWPRSPRGSWTCWP